MKISETLVKQEVKNGYYLECKFMIGDADGYEKEIYHIESEYLKKTILFCLMMDKQYPNGRGGGSEYNYFMKKIHPLAEEVFEEVLCDNWATEPYGDYQQCSWDDYEIFLYKDGQKYKIDYELDEEDEKIVTEAKVLK